ncbi:TetR/AcrR family transcriptional regulator [Streptomyces sp. IB201691-2A2]|uniref:TetR/AcrR family transcriptional regulator n=1 Tax=Streptomyces sp. IB201691-2A2 TaxID=2561920 RepID=UPI00117CC686|nr:TetR/AcrR family transcriptional regulator [Streptomyces sp. IB201691-2A2]TRO57400.1 TetR/AcrR family transcriptional regulator [Streptomyces sp. IB201691-2A2]
MGDMTKTEAGTGTGRRVSEARERLLRTAGQLFYAEGIHTVGVDRLVAEAKVTNATFYRHFRSKEDLAVAYIGSVDQAIRNQIDSLTAADVPTDGILRGIGASLVEQIRSPGYRGCAFLNAAAEFPLPDNPVHRAVVQHREWFLQTITGLFTEIATAQAEHAGRHFVMLRDGAMSAGYLGDRVLTGETLKRGIDGLLRIHTARGLDERAASASGQASSAATTVSGIECSPPST